MIRASAPYTSGWGSFVLLKMDRVRVAQGGSFEHGTPEILEIDSIEISLSSAFFYLQSKLLDASFLSVQLSPLSCIFWPNDRLAPTRLGKLGSTSELRHDLEISCH